MKAIVHERFGSPDVLRLAEIDRPTIGDDGILVRVRATSVNAGDWRGMRGRPYIGRLMGMGLRAPEQTIPGSDLAGVVEAVGADVTDVTPGDEVFGARSGSFAEYVAGRKRNFVPKPESLTFEQAAALPVAALTALQALRDKGRVQPGQRVLVLGAAGGVGTFAVQLAKVLGAEVTGATSTDNVKMVRALGADEVVDYGAEDVTRGRRRFDLVLDVGGYRTLRDLARALTPSGTVVIIGAGRGDSAWIVARLLSGMIRTRLGSQRMLPFLAAIKRDDLLELAELAAAGRIRSVIERTYPLADAAEAMRYAETGKVRGKLVITI